MVLHELEDARFEVIVGDGRCREVELNEPFQQSLHISSHRLPNSLRLADLHPDSADVHIGDRSKAQSSSNHDDPAGMRAAEGHSPEG